jgi:hypothetical protein
MVGRLVTLEGEEYACPGPCNATAVVLALFIMDEAKLWMHSRFIPFVSLLGARTLPMVNLMGFLSLLIA